MVLVSPIRFGAIAVLNKYARIRPDDVEHRGIPIASRLEYARERVEQYRNRGIAADCFAFRWYDAMRDPKAEKGNALYSRGTHLSGYPVPPDVFIVTGKDAEAYRQIKAIDSIAKQNNPLRMDSPGLLAPLELENGHRPFDPQNILKFVTTTHPMLAEWMRFVFSNTTMEVLETNIRGFTMDVWQRLDCDRILGYPID